MSDKVKDFVTDLAYMNPSNINRRSVVNIKRDAAKLLKEWVDEAEPVGEEEVNEFDALEEAFDESLDGRMAAKFMGLGPK